MATIVFSALGTALAGPVGGAIGAMAGRQFEDALLGTGRRRGPRLRELEVSLSSYGLAIPRIHGRMRVPGAIVWATELQEHSDVVGAKGQPATTTYSYTANLTVILSSRPIRELGRVWADGKLLRGAAGDLKVGGALRVYPGSEDQPVDPLIAASEGEARCPAFRGLAYVVFEALDLASFGNRVPALTFEVVADEGVSLSALVGDTVADATAPHALTGFAGLVVEDDLASCLAMLGEAVPIAIDGAGDDLRLRLATASAEPLLLEAPAMSVEDDAVAPASGVVRRRAPAVAQPPAVLRYLDIDRDYQPGTQHATGRAGVGQPEMIELPAALHAAEARNLVEGVARRRESARERIGWRTCALDPAVAPGTLVQLPDRTGTWRVESWEWRESGVEVELTRMDVLAPVPLSVPPLTFPAPADLPPAQTRLVAVELPWTGESQAVQPARVLAFVGADGANWSGAALYADHGDGQLHPHGPAARTRAVVGHMQAPLAAASPLLLDRTSHAIVVLADPDQILTPATLDQLAGGANLALIGEELVQFARAEPLGDRHWRLSGFLRGLGGTEAAIGTHTAAEDFALIDGRGTSIGGLDLGGVSAAGAILALGLGDAEPASSPLHLAGIGRRPLAPVHGRALRHPDGGLRLSWTRRARGGWRWSDGIDVPLVEEAKRYLVTCEQGGEARRSWNVGTPSLELPPAEVAELQGFAPGVLRVRQQGTYALSWPLLLIDLP